MIYRPQKILENPNTQQTISSSNPSSQLQNIVALNRFHCVSNQAINVSDSMLSLVPILSKCKTASKYSTCFSVKPIVFPEFTQSFMLFIFELTYTFDRLMQLKTSQQKQADPSGDGVNGMTLNSQPSMQVPQRIHSVFSIVPFFTIVSTGRLIGQFWVHV